MEKNIVEIGMLCKEPLDYYLDLLKNNGINQKMVLVTRETISVFKPTKPVSSRRKKVLESLLYRHLNEII